MYGIAGWEVVEGGWRRVGRGETVGSVGINDRTSPVPPWRRRTLQDN